MHMPDSRNDPVSLRPRAFLRVAAVATCTFVSLILPPHACGDDNTNSLGHFDNHADIGTVVHPGKLEFDPAKQTYTITASGENMWAKADSLHFAWKQISGDVALEADVAFVGAGKNPHRKACLLVRQDLDTDSAYADVALHGNGLTCLQYREEKGAVTQQVQSSVAAPQRLRIEKRGPYISMWLAAKGEPLHFAGASGRLAFKEPFYVGLGVCSHEKDIPETFVFSNVRLIADLGKDDGFTPLLKGDDLSQFEFVGLDNDAVAVKDGEIRLTGNQKGYVGTKESFQNYVLQFEWLIEKFHAQPADANSGLLVHIQPPAKVWPKAIEVQIWYKDDGSLYSHSGATFKPKHDDRPARDKVLNPPEQWNLQEVSCRDGAITLKVNGVEYASGVGAAPNHGAIGWMFEGSPIRFRNLRIKKL
jgi:Domain of Unknown Function (DUF1080)